MAYPGFSIERTAVKNQANNRSSHAEPSELTYKSDQEIENKRTAIRSAGCYRRLGVRTALGRVFRKRRPQAGGHPYAVISHNYWTPPFLAKDRNVIGATFHMGQ